MLKDKNNIRLYKLMNGEFEDETLELIADFFTIIPI